VVEINEAITSRAIAGDSDALASLLEHLEDELRLRVRRELSGRHRAIIEVDDVMQVTYFEAFLHIERFVLNGPDSLLNWLTAIARNNIVDAVRESGRDKRLPTQKRIQPKSPEDSYVNLLLQLGGSQTTPSRSAARAEAKVLVENAIAQLPEDYERVVRLSDLEERAAPEVARLMDRSAPAVRMLKARAHDCLAQILGTRSRFFSD
jgi:RNA polymerase sigma-70 factor, ECF subfamily